MGNEQIAVSGSESTTDKSADAASLARETNVTSGGRSLEQVIAENKRKSEEIAELREKFQTLSEAQDRLSELQEKSHLSASEKDEAVTLREEIESIKRDKRSKAWRELNKEESRAEAESSIIAREKILTERFIKKNAVKEGMDVDKFERELVQYMRKVDPLAELPVNVRAEDAYDAWKETKAFEKDKAELAKQKQQFKEGSTRTPEIPKSRTELLELAKKDPKAMEIYLKAINDKQAEMHK